MTAHGTLQAYLDRVADAVLQQDDYPRLVKGAEQMDEALITGRYVTHMLSGGHRVLLPFRSHITLRCEDGQWRAASITNALANSRWPILMPSVITSDDPKGQDR